MGNLVESIEKEYKKDKVQFFKVGDTVKVHTKIIEGDKERIQVYNGVVVARRGIGTSESFTVSRVSFGYPNEKVFPLHSPSVDKIEVISRGDVRQSKLGYIRGKIGKKAKVSAKIGGKMDLYNQTIDTNAVEKAGAREDVLTEDKVSAAKDDKPSDTPDKKVPPASLPPKKEEKPKEDKE